MGIQVTGLPICTILVALRVWDPVRSVYENSWLTTTACWLL